MHCGSVHCRRQATCPASSVQHLLCIISEVLAGLPGLFNSISAVPGPQRATTPVMGFGWLRWACTASGPMLCCLHRAVASRLASGPNLYCLCHGVASRLPHAIAGHVPVCTLQKLHLNTHTRQAFLSPCWPCRMCTCANSVAGPTCVGPTAPRGSWTQSLACPCAPSQAHASTR